MHTRENALKEWIKQQLHTSSLQSIPLTGDASFRQYTRIKDEHSSYIVMDAPPAHEKLETFLRIASFLADHHVPVPMIYAADIKQGFALLEDFGDTLLLKHVTHDNAQDLYQKAIQLLLLIQQCPVTNHDVPRFDRKFMEQELNLFKEWFLSAFLNIKLETNEEQLITDFFDQLVTEIESQPYVLVHRDYHSRNLMVLSPSSSNELGVIDFQDAMYGPCAYDLVSLLKDCYIQWPLANIMEWISYYHAHANLPSDFRLPAMIRAVDLCGIQRHLKVLGIFCRLNLRDHKTQYMNDLPLTFEYLIRCLESYPTYRAFYNFMEQRVRPSFLRALQS